MSTIRTSGIDIVSNKSVVPVRCFYLSLTCRSSAGATVLHQESLNQNHSLMTISILVNFDYFVMLPTRLQATFVLL
jgi:hypothetical protein